MKLFKKLVRSLYKRLWRDEWNELKTFIKPSSEINFNLIFPWVEYHKINNIKEKYEILTKGLAPEDTESVNLFLERIKLLTDCYGKEDLLYLNRNKIYTQEEKLKQKESDNCIKQYRKNFPVQCYERSVLYKHSGLKLIPFVEDYIKDKDFIDGGACIGDSAFIFEKYYNPYRVYAFEPLKGNIEYINKTIEMNNLKCVQSVKLGLGDKEEEIELTYDPNDISGASFLYIDKNESVKETIKVTTIDKYVKENNINPGLIKLDVEGYESNVIRGALESIKQYRPVMLISIYHNPKDFFEIKPLIESLNLNYKFKIRKNEPYRLVCETMLICYPAELEK